MVQSKKSKWQKASNSGTKPAGKLGGKGNSIGNKANPFDVVANARNKHNVLNKRVKGANRNVVQSREKALETRKQRLMADFKQNKKRNSFLDKRFGEADPTMSLEDKMFMRFQKEKTNRLRNSAIYNLDGDDNDDTAGGFQLTHKGQALGQSNMNDNDDWSSDDEGGNLEGSIVDKLHFGGGFIPKEDSDGTKKTHAEIIQEIVTKSKIAKLEKKEHKLEQEGGRMALDDDFEALMASNALQLKLSKREQVRSSRAGLGTDMEQSQNQPSQDAVKAGPQVDEWEEYDKAFREMAYEAKAQATDRTKTPEELALENKRKLEQAEHARINRMGNEPASFDGNDTDIAPIVKRERGKQQAAEADLY